MIHRGLFLCAAAVLAAADASAQADSTFATPTCAEQGVQRVVVMIPPGRTADEAREIVSTSFPAGTQIRIIGADELQPLRDGERFDARMTDALYSLLDTGLKIEGTTSTLLVVDESGAVVEAHPGAPRRPMNTRLQNRVNRTLQQAWMTARFEPFEVGGCRVRAYVHVPLSFRSDFSLQQRRLDVTPAEP